MGNVTELYRRMIEGLGIKQLVIPLTAVKFYTSQETIPPALQAEYNHLQEEYYPTEISITSCQAVKQASLGDAVLLTKQNIGCIAAAITFGLVDQNDDEPLTGPRVYTEIMKEQAKMDKNEFRPPTPRDFTEGTVYACHAAGRQDFCLFGEQDAGRFKNKEIARKAIGDMLAIQPPRMQGVFFFSQKQEELDLEPDVIVLSVRPVELTRLVQAYQYSTGERVTGSMGAVRAVNSDLIVRPYLTRQINFSSYCIGARLIAQYEATRLGLGLPYSLFKVMVEGLEASKSGYPFPLYPGAASPGQS